MEQIRLAVLCPEVHKNPYVRHEAMSEIPSLAKKLHDKASVRILLKTHNSLLSNSALIAIKLSFVFFYRVNLNVSEK